ncbi:hypothetical protein CSE16_10260 [Solibacillus sp. R5-41]|uniref:cysteine-rich CWC family protein n=1 Tax=Solibacillus sp. R5-41 TaxID=2048654 RepID=UPI000C128124|nr:cysteine-rich CWC family protein [Solibacillus sp. R5-41]ATP40400.1 hypothetical protein CSE16_10260 [Solibacillus sp. R5-41]
MTLEMNQAKLCPLCQKGNKCGMTDNPSTGECWCFKVVFPKEIFDQLPPDREKVCICENCLVEFKS